MIMPGIRSNYISNDGLLICRRIVNASHADGHGVRRFRVVLLNRIAPRLSHLVQRALRATLLDVGYLSGLDVLQVKIALEPSS